MLCFQLPFVRCRSYWAPFVVRILVAFVLNCYHFIYDTISFSNLQCALYVIRNENSIPLSKLLSLCLLYRKKWKAFKRLPTFGTLCVLIITIFITICTIWLIITWRNSMHGSCSSYYYAFIWLNKFINLYLKFFH